MVTARILEPNYKVHVCWREVPDPSNSLWHHLGVLQFNSIITLFTWREHLILHVKGSVPEDCPSFTPYAYTHTHTHTYTHTHMLLRYCLSWIESLWQPCVEQVCRHYFSHSICSLHVSMPHFGNSCKISNFFIIMVSVMVISDQWSIAKSLWLAEDLHTG